MASRNRELLSDKSLCVHRYVCRSLIELESFIERCMRIAAGIFNVRLEIILVSSGSRFVKECSPKVRQLLGEKFPQREHSKLEFLTNGALSVKNLKQHRATSTS